MKDRIRLIMEEQHLTQQSFSQLLGISPAQLSGIFNGRTKPTLNIVDAIHQKFPQINLSWLLYGIEPIYNEAGLVEQSENVSLSSNSTPNIEGLALNFADEDSAKQTSEDAGEGLTSASVCQHHRVPGSQVTQGSLFDQPQMQSVNKTLKNTPQQNLKNIDIQQRKITEIRIFYDDQTWETFVPKK